MAGVSCSRKFSWIFQGAAGVPSKAPRGILQISAPATKLSGPAEMEALVQSCLSFTSPPWRRQRRTESSGRWGGRQFFLQVYRRDAHGRGRPSGESEAPESTLASIGPYRGSSPSPGVDRRIPGLRVNRRCLVPSHFPPTLL